MSNTTAQSAAKIDLAAEPALGIGWLVVTPTLLEISAGDRRITVEPKVMQVLVALGQTPGRVVSRAELVERCWDGRVVGDNAIQRVISRIRHIGSETRAFELEAITKVGYRLRVVECPAPRPAELQPDSLTPADPATSVHAGMVDRRWALAGLAMVGGLAVAAGVWPVLGTLGSAPTSLGENHARQLLAKARDAQMMGLRENGEQAVAYLKQATVLAPGLADAWGLLALAHADMLDWAPDAQLSAQADWARSAAASALALDPDHIDAQIALAAIPPNFRRWAAKEGDLRRLLATHGSHPVLESHLGFLMCDTGRWHEAIRHFRTALAFEPFHIPNQLTLVRALWGHGQLAEADRILDVGLKTWPRHRWLWRMRFDFLAVTGRAQQALALIRNDDARPLSSHGGATPPYEALAAFAEAMDQMTPAAVARAAEYIGSPASSGPLGRHPFYALSLGLTDAAFEILEAYFLGKGEQPPPTPLSRRKTAVLFTRDAKHLRSLPRFEQLLDRLSLREYWRSTGTRPDPSL